jgi:hypothetical protein
MRYGDFLSLVAVYQIKNEGAEPLEVDTRTTAQKLDALASL